MDKIKVPNTKIVNTLDQGYGKFMCQGVTTDDVKVVIEVYSIDEGASRNDVSELLERVDLYRQLNHPNISKFIDGGDLQGGGAYLSIEMEDEVRLIDRIKNNEWLSPKEATALIIDLAKALEEVHRIGVIHGELRPSNILFNPDTGHVKLRNIFRYRHEKDYVLKMVSRRPEYAAPEQIRFLEIDGRTDMYSLGLIYFQLLTGHKPTEGQNLEEMWRFHLEGEPPLLTKELQSIQGLQEVISTLTQRRKKSRFETDKDLIYALESVYDHLFVEEESSMGRMVTLESSKEERENRKKKGKPHFDPMSSSKRMKKSEKGEAVQAWKKGERRKVKASHSTRRLKQVKADAQEAKEAKEERAKMMGPVIFAGVALFILLVVTKIFYKGAEIEESDFAKEAASISSSSKPDPEPQKLAVTEPKPQQVSKSSQPVTLKEAMKQKQNQKPKVNEKKVVEIPKKFDSRLDEVKFYGKLPPEQALEKLKLFLDDEEMSVRMLAVQLYQEMKHNTFKVDENVESMSEGDMMKLKLQAANEAVPVKLMEDLSKDPSPEEVQILDLAMDHPIEKVRDKAYQNLINNKSEHSYAVFANRLINQPEDELFVDAFVKFGPDYFTQLDKIIDEKGDAIALKFIVPMLLTDGDAKINKFKEWAESRPTIALHVAMELAQVGEEGINYLIKLFEESKKQALALTYLSALRESILSDEHLFKLNELLVKNMSETKKTKLMRLLALRQPESEILKDQSGAEQQAVTLMFISEMKSPPDNLELQRLVELLGVSSKDIDERIMATLEAEGSRSHKYLFSAIKNRISEDLKFRLIEIMASFGDEETLSQLLNLVSSNSTLNSTLKDVIYKKLFLSGDKLIPITLKSKLNLKEKVNILIDLDSVTSQKALLDYFADLKLVEFKKAYSFLLDRETEAQSFVEAMLVHDYEEDILITILKSLEKASFDLSPNLFINHMNHDSSKVRDEVYEIFEEKVESDDDVWVTMYDQAKHEESKEFIINNVGADCAGYNEIIYKGMSEEEDDLRIASYEKVTKFPMAEEYYNSTFTNKLYDEKNKKALTLVINHLLKRPGGPSLPYCVWSKNNGSRTIRKVTDLELSKVSGDLEKVDQLKEQLLEDYKFELRVDILKFLNLIKIDYLPFLLDETNIGDKVALDLLREGVEIQSKKSAPVLLAKLSETKNSQLKKEIETMLEDLRVSYRLDPESGKYILK